MNVFESSWTDRQGLKFYSKGWEPDKKPKAVVALLHGLGEHIGRYAHVGEAFSNAGYAVMGFDLRGHGKSGGLRGHLPSVEAYMRDIDLLLEHVRARYPGLPVFLYGHSLGAILALTYGLRRKPDLKGVIASAPGMHTALEKQPMKVMLAKVLGSLAPTVLMHSGLDPAVLSHDPQVEKDYIGDPLVHDKVSLGFGKRMLESNRWTLQHASEFALPLLLMHGMDDQLNLPSSSTEFAESLNGKAQLVLWDHLYHELHNEPEKAQVFSTAIDWMDERLRQS